MRHTLGLQMIPIEGTFRDEVYGMSHTVCVICWAENGTTFLRDVVFPDSNIINKPSLYFTC